jgi:hypothetical protein
MAAGAGHGCMRSRQRERRGGVVEGRWLPRSRIVTGRTGVTEIVGRMMRTGRAAKVGGMARVAIRRSLTHVIANLVAIGAGHRCMRSRQREWRGGMIECRRRPAGGCVARCTRVTETIGHMIRIRGPIEVGRVTGVTVRRCTAGVAIRVTRPTGHGRMRPGQGERSGRVIESRWLPAGSVVAGRTGMTEVIGRMVRIGRAAEISRVTGITVGRSLAYGVADRMAAATGSRNVCAGQRERRGGVVKSRWLPGGCIVARGARVAEIVRRMVWVGGPAEISCMARIAVSGRPTGIAVGMARAAGGRGMSPAQRESRCRVVEGRWLPGGRVVARGTRMTEIVRRVVRIGGPTEISCMARIAVSGRPTGIAVGMARAARSRSMSSAQREGGSRMVEGGRLPACRIVAGGTGVAEVVRRMIRIGGPAEISRMAGVTIRWGLTNIVPDLVA